MATSQRAKRSDLKLRPSNTPKFASNLGDHVVLDLRPALSQPHQHLDIDGNACVLHRRHGRHVAPAKERALAL
jgi:hypothetical protein